MIDLTDVDDPKNILDPVVHQQIHQNELVDIVESNIKKQYQQLENLGQNYLHMFDNELQDGDKYQILSNLVVYVNEHILSLVDLDNLNGDKERTITAGTYIYELICVDTYASLIPALMELVGITSVDDFDKLINTVYLDTPGKFKTDFLSTIQMTIEQLLKLQQITPDVKNDKQYQKLLGKYYYFQEIIEFGDCDSFLHNFIRPIISKYSSDFIWKLL